MQVFFFYVYTVNSPPIYVDFLYMVSIYAVSFYTVLSFLFLLLAFTLSKKKTVA